MTVTKLTKGSSDVKRQLSELKFPAYTLADSVGVAKAIHDKGGGSATLDELAAHLDYAGTNNGAFLSRVGAARHFDLISKSGDRFVLTQNAQSILNPVYDWMPKEALIEAFFSVELFKKVFEEYKGKSLPPPFGFKNALKTAFKVAPNSVERAYRVLMDSAETAGFFASRSGARTHLIIPTVNKGHASTTPPVDSTGEDSAGGGGGGAGAGGSGGGSNGDSARQSTLSAVKARYIQTLINVLEEKGKQGDLDQSLMERIEKLLETQ